MAISPYVRTYPRPRPTERVGVSRGPMSLGGHAHIFSDFQFVNVYQMTQMRAKPDSLGSPKNNHCHWQIEGCRWRSPTNLYIRALKYVGLSDLL